MNEGNNAVGSPVKPEPALILLINRLKCIKDIASERRAEFEQLLIKFSGSDFLQADNATVPKPENNCFINESNNLLDDIDNELYRLLQISKRFSEII